MEQKLNVKTSIMRLLQYRLSLMKFKELGYQKVFSYNLGEKSGVNAGQVRKDLLQLGIKVKGNKKAGYGIDSLLNELNKIFGKNNTKKIIIVGIGNIGLALIKYNCKFFKKNMSIVAGFDKDPSKQNKKLGIPVYCIDKIGKIIKEENIDIGIIAVPDEKAQDICNILCSNGIKGIMNFAPVILKVPEKIVVNNINLCNELESITYFINLI
jgi:redox-sensing transcriptional repressor